MINLRLIETNYDELNAKLKAKKVDDGVLAKLLEAYNNLKSKRLELENIQAIQNAKSKELGIKAKNKEDISELKSELDANKKELQSLLGIVSELELNLEKIAKSVPNIIDDDVPLGKDEDNNVCILSVLSPREFTR